MKYKKFVHWDKQVVVLQSSAIQTLQKERVQWDGVAERAPGKPQMNEHNVENKMKYD